MLLTPLLFLLFAVPPAEPGSIHEAARAGNAPLVEQLLNAGGSANDAGPHGVTALEAASREGYAGIVKVLLEHRANPNLRDYEGKTALHYAVERHDVRIVELLVSHGASATLKNTNGVTPLGAAIRGGDKGIIALVERGLAPAEPSPAGGEPWSLYQAALRGQTGVVKMLLNLRVQPDTRGPDGATPLHAACLKGHAETAMALLDGGAKISGRDARGMTPLMDAALGGSSETVEALLSRGAPIDEVSVTTGSTALFYAVEFNRLSVVRLLIAKGASATIRNHEGLTPLQAAIRWGSDSKLVDLLTPKTSR